jgi:hypothetical protein
MDKPVLAVQYFAKMIIDAHTVIHGNRAVLKEFLELNNPVFSFHPPW